MTKDEVLALALQELEDLWSFYGMNLEVTNWHMNGDLEPLDAFFEGCDCGALDALKKYKEETSSE